MKRTICCGQQVWCEYFSACCRLVLLVLALALVLVLVLVLALRCWCCWCCYCCSNIHFVGCILCLRV
eukprot:COSAG06_NODE_68278_length_233_cov_15.328358_2_plen_66_part_01